jgi:hypothetical protein
MQTNVAPRIQGMTSQIVEQQSLDFDGVLNFDLSGGTAIPRAGWNILRAPDSYNEVADPMSPDGFSYEVATYTYAAVKESDPLGSFLWSGPDGEDFIISLSLRYLASLGVLFPSGVQVKVYDTQGRTVYERLLLSDTDTESRNTPYTFARLYDTVYFANGGLLWQWNPLVNMRPAPVEAFHNPQQVGVDTYLLGYIQGASIVAAHQQSLVLSGFASDTSVDVDAPIDTNGDGIVTVLDYSKQGGFRLGPSATSLLLTPYTMLVSDPLLPNCFSVQGIYNIGTQMPVTGIASHYGRMAVLTSSECFVVDGPAAQASQATIQPLSTYIGCVSHRTLAQSDDGLLLWLGDDGVYAWDGSGLPAMVANQLQDLFNQGWTVVWQQPLNTNGLNSNITRDSSRFFRFDRSASSLACAVWVARGGYYALAMAASPVPEYNNAILCWSPSRKVWWIYGSEPTTVDWTQQISGTDVYYTPAGTPAGSVYRGSATSGHCTLMVSPNEPGLLFSQGFYNEYPQGQIGGSQAFPYPYHHCIAALNGDTDNKLTWSGTSPIVGRSTFVALLQSAPFYLEQDDYKRNKWLQLKLRASRNATTPCMDDGNFAKTETIGIWCMSENAHFDVLDCTVSSAELQDITPSGTVASGDGVVQPWPDAFIRQDLTYFWQDDATDDVAFGAWWDTLLTPTPNNPAFKRWMPDTFFNKRVNLSQRASQWYRVMLFTKCTGCWDDGGQSGNGSNSLELLGWSIDLEPMTGQRK